MNQLIIIGNLTADPEARVTAAGRDVCNFTVAVNRRNRSENNNQPDADFFRVSAFDNLGKVCKQFLAKGRKVAVVGAVSANAYMRTNGEIAASLNVIANSVEFLSSKDSGGNGTVVNDPDDPFMPRG